MEEKRRRRVFGFGFCCSLFGLVAIVVLGSVLPVVLIPRSTTTNEATVVTTTTSIVPTTVVVTTTSIIPTTAPIVTPSFFRSSNIVDYSFPKNKFIRMNYTRNEIPISLVVYQESGSGMVDWETKIPCFNTTTPASGFQGHSVTIDTTDQSIFVNALCMNFTENMTRAFTFKFDTNGNLLWRTQLPAVFINIYPERVKIVGNDIFFLQGISIFISVGNSILVKLDKISGNILDFRDNIYFYNFCDPVPSFFARIFVFDLMENGTLFLNLRLSSLTTELFCNVFVDVNYNFVRKTQAIYINGTGTNNVFLNTTDGSHTIFTPIRMVKYDGFGNLVAFYNVSTPDRLYNQIHNLKYPFVYYNNFHYMMINWVSFPFTITPYNQTAQLAKFDFANNSVQLGPDILIESFANFTVWNTDSYFLTSPQLFNNSLLLAAYRGVSETKYQFKQYYQFSITF